MPLSEAILTALRTHGTLRAADIDALFVTVDRSTLHRVLAELVEDGLLFRAGCGQGRMYCAATREQIDLMASAPDDTPHS